EKFELGYSPSGWESFTSHALKSGYTAEMLENAGLSIRREGQESHFDRFRERVMFPIHNISGKVIAFGGRTLKADKKTAKYINSPETAVYHKSEVLYGLFQAKNAIRQADLCYLVEGYVDVISLHQGGIENVVASSGTSLTIEQIRLIHRFTPNITILYDGDPAGVKAALRGLDLVLEEGMNVNVVTFPENHDPDSYMRLVGSARFMEHLQTAVRDFISFKTEVLLQDAGNDPFKRAEIITEVVGSIAKIPNAITRQVFYARVSELMKIDEQTLISEGNKILRKQQTSKQKDKQQDSAQRVADMLAPPPEIPHDLFAVPPEEVVDNTAQARHGVEQECVRLLVLYGTIEIEEGITVSDYILEETHDQTFRDPTFQAILSIFREEARKGVIPDTDFFIHHPDEAIKATAISWVTPKYEVSQLWFDKHEIYVPTELDVLPKSSFQTLFRLLKHSLEEELKKLVQEMKGLQDDDKILELQAQYMDVKKKCML